MKKSINAWVATFVAIGSFALGVALGNWSYRDQVQKIQAYRGYYVSTEHLLDLLDNKYHWVDAFDHDGYYESRVEIEYLDYYGIKSEEKRQEYCFKMNELYQNK